MIHVNLSNVRNSALCLFLFLFTSCHQTQTEIPVIDIDNPTGIVDLKFSDLLEDYTIVPIETRDDLLLTASMTFMVSNHYILVNTNDRLLQFDRQGKFLRTLATKGNGPNEFTYIRNPLIDEKREILYYTGMSSNTSIACIDLKKEGFPQSPHPNIPQFTTNGIDAQGNIYGFSTSNTVRIGEAPQTSDSLILAYRYNTDDKSTTLFRGAHTLSTGNSGQMMYRQGDQIHLLSFPYSDTLFRIDGDKTVPQSIIRMKNKIGTDFEKDGISLSISISGAQGTIISKILRQIHVSRNGSEISSITILALLSDYLFLNKKNELQTLRSVTIDPIAHTIPVADYIKLRNDGLRDQILVNPIPERSGLWGYWIVEASNMIELINTAIQSGKLSFSQRTILEDVASNIDDDSNPVLIIGKLK